MEYYQEITLLPDPEISLGFLWQNVFQQVHIALVENKVGENASLIGVGFPDYRKASFPFGNKLRLFAPDPTLLETLAMEQWLGRFADYVHIKGIKSVPNHATYVRFVRKQVKSPERIERDMQQKAVLWSAKSGKLLAECLKELEKTKPIGNSRLPFIYLHSQQTKQRSPNTNSKFQLFIDMQSQELPCEGKFDCYGLSSKANGDPTVPQF